MQGSVGAQVQHHRGGRKTEPERHIEVVYSGVVGGDTCGHLCHPFHGMVRENRAPDAPSETLSR